jgi:hypothetical protein
LEQGTSHEPFHRNVQPGHWPGFFHFVRRRNWQISNGLAQRVTAAWTKEAPYQAVLLLLESMIPKNRADSFVPLASGFIPRFSGVPRCAIL